MEKSPLSLYARFLLKTFSVEIQLILIWRGSGTICQIRLYLFQGQGFRSELNSVVRYPCLPLKTLSFLIRLKIAYSIWKWNFVRDTLRFLLLLFLEMFRTNP